MLGDCLISFNGQVLHCERLLVSVTEDTHIRTAVSGTDDHSPSRADEAVFVNHPFHAGNRVSVAGSLSSFQPARNPGNFDWRLYYLSRHISYRVYADTITLTDNRRNLLSDGTLRLRQYLESRLDSMNFGSSDTAATLKALLLGDKTALEEETKAKYEDGGILHILSVSGLHVSLLGGAILLLGRFLYLPARLRGIFASLLIFLYWQLCGSGLSAGRAAIMFACLSSNPAFRAYLRFPVCHVTRRSVLSARLPSYVVSVRLSIILRSHPGYSAGLSGF